MKIRTEKDVNLLEKKIKEDFDINISKYKNDDVAATFAELLVYVGLFIALRLKSKCFFSAVD